MAVGESPPDPGDEAILAWAVRERRVLITLDKDFGELAVGQGKPQTGIVRLAGIRTRDQGRLVADVISRYALDLGNRSIITVEPGRVRVRSGD